VNDETLGETLLEIATMMLLAIILALLLMGAFGISLRDIPKEPKRHAHPTVVRSFGPQDLGHSDVGPNP
jgi:hypothetical protein